MKIKTDFVTNSSSTSYICIVPKLFDIRNDLDLTKANKYREDFGKNDLNDDDLERIISTFESKKNGGMIYGYGEEYVDYLVILKLLEKNKFIVSEIDGGPDDNKINFLNIDKVKEITCS